MANKIFNKMKFIVIISFILSLANCSKSTTEANENPIQTPTQIENEVDFWLTKSDASVKLQKQELVLAFGSNSNTINVCLKTKH